MRKHLSITIDLVKFGKKLSKKKQWIKVRELAEELGISTKSAGRILAALEKLGFVEKRSVGVYKIIRYHYKDQYINCV